MTYAMSGEIEFPAVRDRQKITIRRFSSVKIDSNRKNLTDTATIVLPRRVKDFDRFDIKNVFQTGDPVIIRLGYDGELHTEFEGYIAQVSTYVPVVIDCEDEMFQLKRKTVSISRASCSLKELLKAVAGEYPIECDEIPIGSVRYANKLVSEILDDLKEKMKLYSYFRGKTLFSGRASNTGTRIAVVVEKQASDSLKDKNVEKVMVRVESLQWVKKKGQKRKLIAMKGEKSGQVITIKQPNLTQIEIERIANDLYTKAKQPGLDGELTLFGVPRLEHGMIVDLSSYLYEERNGSYYIDSVVKSVEIGQGYRQVAKLGNKTTM
ncbi:hypothetical protein EZS27_005326 [termite gut metagenome]|uniref:Uncharacterized protein n=1 Tax=termite gut metagenome TaxID=433724 RepID=A0A5J4SMG0_9ZZZZ